MVKEYCLDDGMLNNEAERLKRAFSTPDMDAAAFSKNQVTSMITTISTRLADAIPDDAVRRCREEGAPSPPCSTPAFPSEGKFYTEHWVNNVYRKHNFQTDDGRRHCMCIPCTSYRKRFGLPSTGFYGWQPDVDRKFSKN